MVHIAANCFYTYIISLAQTLHCRKTITKHVSAHRVQHHSIIIANATTQQFMCITGSEQLHKDMLCTNTSRSHIKETPYIQWRTALQQNIKTSHKNVCTLVKQLHAIFQICTSIYRINHCIQLLTEDCAILCKTLPQTKLQVV